ncbi:MAG: hypothetical protein KGH69_03035 [Candidatus Micrarchaeota archaeon]|nr:hypothetical protein [Candidatus Micrarchaeota archaeon]
MTLDLFSDAGWPNLPDFRTVQWRAKKLSNGRISMDIAWCDSATCILIIATRPDSSKAIKAPRRVPLHEARKLVRALGSDYTEMAL